jgi:hypothetical protein
MKRSTLPAPKGRAPIPFPSSPLTSVSGHQAPAGPSGHQRGTQPPPKPTKAQDQDQDKDQDPDQDQYQDQDRNQTRTRTRTQTRTRTRNKNPELYIEPPKTLHYIESLNIELFFCITLLFHFYTFIYLFLLYLNSIFFLFC